MDLNNIDFLGIKITILIPMRSNIINILLNNSINQITNLLLNLLQKLFHMILQNDIFCFYCLH